MPYVNLSLWVSIKTREANLETWSENFRGISPLSRASKIFAHFLLNRFDTVSEKNLQESAWLSTRTKYCKHGICHEASPEVHWAEHTSVFCLHGPDKGIWHCTQCLGHPEMFGCPKKFVELIQLLHNRMTGSLQQWHISCICHLQCDKSGFVC